MGMIVIKAPTHKGFAAKSSRRISCVAWNGVATAAWARWNCHLSGSFSWAGRASCVSVIKFPLLW